MGKLHGIFELFDGNARFFVREPTHNPPHVHVYGRTNEIHAVFDYEDGEWKVRLSKGFADSDLSQIAEYLRYENRTKPILDKIAEILPSAPKKG